MDRRAIETCGLLESWCASGWDPQETVNTSVIVVAAYWNDDSLVDALLEIEKVAPYKNFVVRVHPQQSPKLDRSGLTFHWPLHFEHDASMDTGLLVIDTTNHSDWRSPDFGIRIRYSRRIEAFRGLGNVLAGLVGLPSSAQDSISRFHVQEQASFNRQGLMLDCSRGGVPNIDTIKFFLAKMALLGINTLMLYTEDTFEIPDEPFFGYLRGRLSQAELRQIDNHAHMFGIEVIPCIQTLGHLGQMLQWPRYHHLRDTHEVLLAHSKDTYDFLEKMIRAACSPFRSKKVHIGMDECFGLGEGRHRSFFPGSHRSQVFLDHLDAVTRICQSFDLEPLIWSDMLFCLANQNISLQGYYDDNDLTTAGLGGNGALPKIELVYWDYYHTAEGSYQERIKAHQQLGCGDPWVASGIWTWNRFWMAAPFTLQVTKACMSACKGPGSKGFGQSSPIRNVITTIWGDDGNECDWYSALPGLIYYAHLGYTSDDEIDPIKQSRWFAGICGGNLFDWIQACRLDHYSLESSPVNSHTQFPANMSKWLLWEDPIHGHLSPQTSPKTALNYSNLHDILLFATSKGSLELYPFNTHLQIVCNHAYVLALKVGLRAQLRTAYANDDLAGMIDLVESRAARLPDAVRAMWKMHRANWMKRFKPHGWEIVEIRYGGLAARADTLLYRLSGYIRTRQRQQHKVPKDGAEIGRTHPSSSSEERDAIELSAELQQISIDGSLGGHEEVAQLEELSEDTLVVWEGLGERVVIDYARACTPMRGMGTG